VAARTLAVRVVPALLPDQVKPLVVMSFSPRRHFARSDLRPDRFTRKMPMDVERDSRLAEADSALISARDAGFLRPGALSRSLPESRLEGEDGNESSKYRYIFPAFHGHCYAN
jgi:hypothetical protein